MTIWRRLSFFHYARILFRFRRHFDSSSAFFEFSRKISYFFSRKMQSPILRVAREAPKLFKRNIGVCAPVLQKASEPIQQLFVDKLREYKSKSSGGKLVEPSPEMEKELKANLEKVFLQYGGKPGEDITKFPAISFPEANIDPINTESK